MKEIDKTESYTSAGGGLPAKLLQSKGAIDEDGRIVPFHLQICPTNQCNLNCEFCSCSARNRNIELPWATAQDILINFFLLGTRALTITGGGEPLVYPHINDFVSLAKKLQIDVGIVTNGILINTLEHDNLMWIRLSTSDDRNLNQAFWKQLSDAIKSRPNCGWHFSHVLTRNPDYEKIKDVLAFASDHNFTHVRIVSDLLDLDVVPDMSQVKSELAGCLGEDIVIYQERKKFTLGRKRCLIGLLKPVIGPDGNVFPCCGVQYALADSARDLDPRMNMGHYSEFKSRFMKQKPFNGSACVKCYYDNYNLVLDLMTRPIEHRRHV